LAQDALLKTVDEPLRVPQPWSCVMAECVYFMR